MPVLELTQLRLKNVAPDDPSLLEALSTVRDALQTQSQFYSCIEDPALIYILGLWPTLDAHLEFLASPRAKEILAPQEGILDFGWTVHLEMDAMDSLPLGAPILAITRRTVRAERIYAYGDALARERQALLKTGEYKFAGGRRIDAAPGMHEAVAFTGWNTIQAHAAFTQLAETDDYPTNELSGASAHTHHAWNLEKRQT